MDSNSNSKAVLDYALFQLTPTRTRCELLVFSGGIHQKIASGLFEPFVSHLKFVKDEISKGGYSIKLLPPTNAAFWFTKPTFERFVRFVSTPAILERFVSLENEILQIESSFQANALSMSIATLDEGIIPQTNGNTRRLSDSGKLNDVLEGVDSKEEENSKVSLHRLLESRIALLRKEQAMAYTRGLVAGFEIDSIEDLINFANAFGAVRLREACIKFKELWKKKHADDLWIKEVAAMQSSLPPALSLSGASGIILANDITPHDQNNKNNSSKDSIASGDENVFLETTSSASLNKKEGMPCADVNLPTPDQQPSHAANVHMPMPWPYNVPPFMYNLQNSIPQMPSYQGYPLTNMQSVPPYLLRNMQWSSDQGVNQKPSATKREKSPYKKGAEEYEDQQTESSDPDSGSESDSDKQKHSNNSSKDDLKRKKHRRKSSGTVVIRNINYITPKRRNGNEGGVSDESSEDDNVIDEETIKQKVGVALESLQKVHKVEKRANGKKASARRNVTKSSDATEEDLTENLSDASEGGNKNDNWDTFQNLLKIDEGTGTDGPERMQSIDVQDEHFVVRSTEKRMPYAASSSPNLDFKEVLKNPKVPNDSFIVTSRDGGNESGSKLDEYVDNCGPVTKSRDNMGEEMLLSHRSKEPGNELGDPLSTFVADSLQTKGRTTDDWFIVDNLEKMRSPDPPIVPAVFDDDYTSSSVNDHSRAEKREGTLVDDSFMIHGQLVDNDVSDSQWKTDISMVADLTALNKLESDAASSNEKRALLKNQEPNDLFVVLQRDPGLDSVEASRTMDYEIDFSFSETDRRSSIDVSHDNVNNNLPVSPVETNVSKSKVSGTRKSEKEEKLRGSSGKGKPEIMSRARKPSLPSRPVVQKSKREQEDEIRKKMEELRSERQRRIAERTASSGVARAVPRKDQSEGKTARISAKSDKNKTQSVKETNRISSVKLASQDFRE
ncbi:COP1-interacting protein 7 [Mucuna pruriens]|uniref:COP1-interacting protein 7 n=1 Tax=Mucuna pruriens TaxID=157652 RepID=A0A371HNJ4_MUCPR|nr:COP1-interacting protein 7 [Mucuna pruriens]